MSETPVTKDRISVLKKVSTEQADIFIEPLSRTFNNWELFMVNFQKYWVDIILLLKFVRSKSKYAWNDLKTYFQITESRSEVKFFENLEKIIDSEGFSFHSVFRCYTAAKLLELFLSDKKGKLKARLINFVDPPFPDHIWMEIQNENGNIMYILQAFYYAYTFNGTYGFYRIDKDLIPDYKKVKNSYRKLSDPLYFTTEWQNQVLNTNKKFETFTGVDTSRHRIATDYINKFVDNEYKYSPHIVEGSWFNISTTLSKTQVAIHRMRRLIEGLYLQMNRYRFPRQVTWINSNPDYFIFNCEINPIRPFDLEFIGLRSEIGSDNCFFRLEPQCTSPCKWYNEIKECNIEKKWKKEEGYHYQTYKIQDITIDVETICFSFISTLNRIQDHKQKSLIVFLRYFKNAQNLYRFYRVAYIFDDIPMEVDAPEKETQSRLYLGVPIR